MKYRLPPFQAAILAAFFVSALGAGHAWAQGTMQQLGPVTKGQIPMYVGNGQVIGTGGVSAVGQPPANPKKPGTLPSGIAIANPGQGFALYSGYATGTPFSELLLGFDGAGNGVLNLNSVGGGSPTFSIQVNGATVLLSPQGVPVFPTNASIQALAAGAYPTLIRDGFFRQGDSPVVVYNWLSTCPAAPDNGRYIAPTAGGSGCLSGNIQQADVTIWGAKCDGATDDHSAIDSAMNAASSLLVPVWFPRACATSTALAPLENTTFACPDNYQSGLVTLSATVDLIAANNPAFTLSQCYLQAAVTRTAGSLLLLNATSMKVLNTQFNGGWKQITLGASTAFSLLDNLIIGNTATGGTSMLVTGCFGCMARNLLFDNAATAPASNMEFQNSGDFVCDDCNLLSATINLLIDPAVGQNVDSLQFNGGFFDHGISRNLVIAPTGTGAVARSRFTGVGIASAPGNNVDISSTGSASVNGIFFDGCDAMLSSSGTGLAVSGTVQNVIWNGGNIAQNAIGVYVAGSASRVTVTGAGLGASGGLTGNAIGVSLNGSADYVDINHNQQLPSNSTVITNTSTGTHNRVQDNPGYNPVGPSVISVGASPFTYTAGLSPETVYILGGTTSNITQNGVGIIAGGTTGGTANLGPNESIAVAYSAPPTMTKMVH